MGEEKTIVYSYNKDTKTYTIDYKEMQKINRKLKERFTLKQQNKQLQNNWNELKSWLETNKYSMTCQMFVAEELLEKMQELEQGKDE